MKETLETILLTQSPTLFLGALVLIFCYFVRRRSHHVRAVLDLMLGILCIALGIALYFIGIGNETFTIKDFWQVRAPGWVGMGIVAVLAVYTLLRNIKRSADRHRAERAASRAETARQKELEDVRQKAYASGMADAMAAESRTVPEEADASLPAAESVAELPVEVPAETRAGSPENAQ